MTPRKSARPWLSALLTVGLVLGGWLVSAAPAHAATTYRINSVASCQAFLSAVGATIGSASPGSCVVSSEGSEVYLPAGDTLVVAPGWKLTVDSVVFFNEGTIKNFGTFRSVGDVVNNVGVARFLNYGRVRVESALNVMDDALVLNAWGARMYAAEGAGIWVAGTLVNRGLIAVAGSLTVADWYDGKVYNKGRILVLCGGSVSGTVIGRPPVYVAPTR